MNVNRRNTEWQLFLHPHFIIINLLDGIFTNVVINLIRLKAQLWIFLSQSCSSTLEEQLFNEEIAA